MAKILVVDGEPNIRIVASQYQRRHGYASVSAVDGIILSRAEPCGKVAQIEVSGTGKGMPPKTCHTSSSAHRRGRSCGRERAIKANPDTGSSLAIARGLNELQDCEIDVESRLGHNITFRFTLTRS